MHIIRIRMHCACCCWHNFKVFIIKRDHACIKRIIKICLVFSKRQCLVIGCKNSNISCCNKSAWECEDITIAIKNDCISLHDHVVDKLDDLPHNSVLELSSGTCNLTHPHK